MCRRRRPASREAARALGEAERFLVASTADSPRPGSPVRFDRMPAIERARFRGPGCKVSRGAFGNVRAVSTTHGLSGLATSPARRGFRRVPMAYR